MSRAHGRILVAAAAGAFILIAVGTASGVALGATASTTARLGEDGVVKATASHDRPDEVQEPLAVAIVLDLRLPPAHSADGGANLDTASKQRIVELAEVLRERPDMAMTFEISGETLDALALLGDDTTTAALSAMLQGHEVLASPWTSLDIEAWIAAGRGDVVIDGFQRSNRALAWIDMRPGNTARLATAPDPQTVNLLSSPAIGVSSFLANTPDTAVAMQPAPVAWVADSDDGRYPLIHTDPTLRINSQGPNAGNRVQQVIDELLRIAANDSERQAVVMEVGLVEPDTLTTLLNALNNHAALQPVALQRMVSSHTANAVVAGQPTTVTQELLDHLAQRSPVELRLEAYEALIGEASEAATPLRTLLAVSVGSSLAVSDRLGYLDAVDAQITQRSTGVNLVARERITITQPKADLPLTLISTQPGPITVAVALRSQRVNLADGERVSFLVQPGRNNLSVPIEVNQTGDATIFVQVTTPDLASAITLSSGTLTIRYTAASGIGYVITLAATVVLALWWLRTRHRRSLAVTSAGGSLTATPNPE